VVVPKSHVESLMSPELVEPSLLVALVTAVQSVARRLGLDRAGFHVEAYAMDPKVTPHVHLARFWAWPRSAPRRRRPEQALSYSRLIMSSLASSPSRRWRSGSATG